MGLHAKELRDMQSSRLQKAAALSYQAIAALFLLFFVYICCFENVSMESARPLRTSSTVEDYAAEDIADPSAPIGVRREYRWTLGDVTDNDSSLAFYVVHHYAEVFLDGELIYRLVPMDTNRIGKSISSNWVIVPLYPADSGKEVRVVLTPVYESVRSRPVEFHIGSFYSLYSAQLRSDLPQLLRSAACILLGFFTLVVQAFLISFNCKICV